MISFFLFACDPQPVQKTIQEPAVLISSQEIDVSLLYEKKQQGSPTIIDVRTPEEFAAGHVPNAQNIPLDTLEKRYNELTPHKESEIFLICASGRRSQKATEILSAKGFTHAINVAGGTSGWQAKGYPTEK